MKDDPHSAIVVALGGNLGGPREVVTRFVDVARRLQVLWGPARASHPYVTAPVGPVQDQPDFVNAVVAYWPELRPSPEDALALLQALETEHGRERSLPGGARTLDLDLLLHADEERNQPGLQVPHPRMVDRAFVLRPLQELFGDDFQWNQEVPCVGTLLLRPDVAAQSCEILSDDIEAER